MIKGSKNPLPTEGRVATTIFDFAEKIAVTTSDVQKGGELLTLNVPTDMPRRRLYAYLYTYSGVAGASYLIGNVSFKKNGAPVQSKFPLSASNQAGADALNKSIVSIANVVSFTANTTPPPADSILANFSALLSSEVANAYLIPFYFVGDFDTVTFNIEDFRNLQSYRVLIAMASDV